MDDGGEHRPCPAEAYEKTLKGPTQEQPAINSSSEGTRGVRHSDTAYIREALVSRQRLTPAVQNPERISSCREITAPQLPTCPAGLPAAGGPRTAARARGRPGAAVAAGCLLRAAGHGGGLITRPGPEHPGE